jgi:ubiquinone biosynthesis protein
MANALFATVGNLDRLRQITQVLVKHGFGELIARTDLAALVPFRKKPEADEEKKSGLPVRMRLAMQELGPSFVKLGQILSTRSDLLPVDLVTELKKLQEDVPPITFDEVRATIEETCGAPLAQIFETFDEKPLASASIGQVHKATLKRTDGTMADVAVKVQRPNIRTTIERDLDLLYLLARLLERAVPESTIYSPTGLVSEFDKAITAELDYTIEAENGAKFARNFANNPNVKFPVVHREVSGKKVLVAEFFDGLHIDRAMIEGYSGEKIAKESVQIIAQMIFVDGFFHADPHPGNIRILGPADKPIVGLLDLGLVGVLAPDMREKATDLMIAAVKKDVDELADALLAMGKPRGKVDRAAFRARVLSLSDQHLGKPLKEIQLAALVRDLVQGAIEFDIEMPPEMMMVGKALMTVEGIGKSIYPDLDVFDEAKPFFLRLLWQRYSPEKVGQRLLKAATRLSGAAQDVPPLLAEVLDDVRHGRLQLEARDPGLGRAAERLGRRIALGIMGAAWVCSGAALYITNHPRTANLFFAFAGLSMLLAWGTLPKLGKKK